MRLLQFSALVLLFSLFSCKSKEALDFNEKIITIEKSLGPEINKTEEQVEKFFRNEQFDSAIVVSQRMESLVEGKIKEVQDIPAPDVKEGDNLKKAAIRYFGYMKSIYSSYKTFAQQTTEEGREKERQNIIKLSGEKPAALADIQTAQKKYADANGFKIQ